MTTSSPDKNLPADQLTESFYRSPTMARKFKLTILGLIIFTTGFALNFPLSQKIEDFIEVSLLGQVGCPITHEGIKTSFFFPSVEIMHPKISGQCFDSYNDIRLQSIKLSMAVPSVIPPGPRFFIPIEMEKSKVGIHATPSYNGIHINIRDAVVGEDLISLFTARPRAIEGSFNLNTIMSLPYNGGPPSDANIQIISRNLFIPTQNIQGFVLPPLPLNNFSLKANIKDEDLDLRELIIGDDRSPIIGHLSGPITLNPHNMAHSQLDLSGSLRFSEEFLEEFSFIQMFMQGAQSEDGSYSLAIRGTLAQPNPSFN